MKRTTTLLLALVGAGMASVLAPTAAHAVPGLDFRSASSALDGTDTKSVSVACPAGTAPLGGGFFVSGGGGGRISVTRLQALPPSGTFAVTATEADDGAPGAWRLHGYALCAPAPAGLEYVSFSTPADSGSAKVATATCPAGKKVVGTGVRLLGDAGQVVVDDVVPSPGLTSVSVAAYEDGTGYAGNWSLRAYATCANPLPNQTLQKADTQPADSADDAVGIACPGGTQVHGLGGSVTGALGKVLFGGLYPTADRTQAVAVTVEQNAGHAGNWYTTAYAICVS